MKRERQGDFHLAVTHLVRHGIDTIMRIRFLETLSTPVEVYLGAKEYEMDDLTARQAIRAGIALEVKPEPKPLPKPKAEKPKAEPTQSK